MACVYAWITTSAAHMRLRRDYQVQEAVPDPVAEIGPLVVQPKPPPEGTRCIHQQRKMAAVAALVLLGCAAVVTVMVLASSGDTPSPSLPEETEKNALLATVKSGSGWPP